MTRFPPARDWTTETSDSVEPVVPVHRLLPTARRLALDPALPRLLDPALPRRQRLLLESSADLEAWLCAWPPGSGSGWHDHGRSSGGILVIQGQLLEQSWDHGRRVDRLRRSGQGCTFAPYHAHSVVNVGALPVLSVHVYSPLLSSVTRYDLTADGPLAGHAERVGIEW